MSARSSVAALVLVRSLRTVLTVSYLPLAGEVARLDTATPAWLLELDSGSSSEDHCLVMIDVLRVMSFGPQAAEYARASRRLRVIRN